MAITWSGRHLRLDVEELKAGGVLLATGLQAQFACGQIHWLQGQNGVGKSTLLRCMARALGQQAFLLAHPFGLREELKVKDQLLAHLTALGFEEANLHKVLEQSLTQVGLADWALERVATLSSGQKARLGLAALQASGCRVWLLDEPLNALDEAGVSLLGGMLENHVASGGLVVLASHQGLDGLTPGNRTMALSVWALSEGQLRRTFQFEQAHADALEHAQLQADSASAFYQSPSVSLGQVWLREWALLRANPQDLFWSALFYWMITGFFGLAVLKSDSPFALATVWVGAILAILLAAKDWFSEDFRVGWMAFVHNTAKYGAEKYWLARSVGSVLSLSASTMPVVILAAIQFDLGLQQWVWLELALFCGIFAVTPLLGLISLMVMLTRGGAVLVYVLALPILVPVLIFGMEASQAAVQGRSPESPFAVLVLLGIMGCIVAPVVARRLIDLIQE